MSAKEVVANLSDTQSSGAESEANATKILHDILERKQKQKEKKAQPWQSGYVAPGEHKPTSSSLHDKPWLSKEWNDPEYDCPSGGQS
jgi:cyclopropane fatty-acyl-phospholipid synthase-like methyltransferase